MPILTLEDNNSIHFQEFNPEADETIVMVHGMFGNLSVYYFDIAPMLAERYHVIMYDLKGHGKSSRHTYGYDLKSMARDLSAIIERLNIQKTHLVGYSYGGLIALKYTMKAPDIVDKLVVIDSPDLKEVSNSSFEKEYNNEVLKPYLTRYGVNDIKNLSKRQIDRHKDLFQFLMKDTTIKMDLELEKRFMDDPGLKGLANDTLLLYGRASKFKNGAAKLMDVLPNAWLAWMDGEHSMPMLYPREVANEIMTFFQRNTKLTVSHEIEELEESMVV